MSFRGTWNAYSVFHLSAAEPDSLPICLRDAWPKWQIILPLKFSIFTTFYLPLRTPPFPVYFYHIDFTSPNPLFRHTLGTPSLSRCLRPHNEMASSQVVRTYFISSTLRYCVACRTCSLGRHSRQMRSGSIFGRRQHREEQWPPCHLGSADSPTTRTQAQMRIGADVVSQDVIAKRDTKWTGTYRHTSQIDSIFKVTLPLQTQWESVPGERCATTWFYKVDLSLIVSSCCAWKGQCPDLHRISDTGKTISNSQQGAILQNVRVPRSPQNF
jgi:hypothetical protein